MSDPSAERSAEPSRRDRFLALAWLPPVGRASVLLALVGASLTLCAQTAFQARWVRDFALENQLDPGRRRLLLFTLMAGAAVGVAIAIGLALRLASRGRPWAELERVAWRVSPLVVAGVLPLVFRQSLWRGRALDLLIVVGLTALSAEGSLRRSLAVMPEALAGAFERLRMRVPERIAAHAPTLAVCAGAAFYSLSMTHWTIVRHRRLHSAVFDLGISDNLMYNALSGHFMRAPVFSGAADGLSFVANHFQIGQYLFLPIYALAPSAETLLGIQSFALGLGAIPLYAFARRRLSGWASALVALAFLLYHPMHGANFYEMTYLSVACPFVIGTFWALDAGRYRWLAALLLAALTMREDVSLGIAIVAFGCVLANHRPRAALAVAGVASVYFVLVRFVIMPAAGTWIFPDLMYRELLPEGAPSTFGSVIQTLLTNPTFALSKLATGDKLVFLLHVLVPVVFLPMRRAWLAVALVPGAVTTLITTGYAPTVSMGFHYSMHWAPYVWLAVPVALSELARTVPGGVERMRAALCALALSVLALSVNLGAFFRPSDFRTGFSSFDFRWEDQDEVRYRQLRELIQLIPRDASVAVMEHVGAHASNRVEARSMRAGPQDADYILAGRNDGVADERAHLMAVLREGSYGVLARRGEFALLKKGHDVARNGQLARDWRW